MKRILKKIFPTILLKDAFLIFNRIKIQTWDKIFFPEKIIPFDQFLINEEKNPFLENDIPIFHFPQEAQNKLAIWLDPNWKQDQYFLHYKESAFLEPRTGWAVTGANKLIYPSLGFSRAPHVLKPSWKESYFNKRNIINLGKIISLRDTGEENYFHFYNDILAKLFFILDNGFDLKEFTIVVSVKLFQKEFFQFFFERTWLKELTLHIQVTEWIFFSEAIFCKPYTHTKRYLDLSRNLLQTNSIGGGERRIFLTRSRQSLRFIENDNDISHLLKKNSFEIIDSANLNVARQVELFTQCKYLISIHGAGLTNIIFRQGLPLTILEIFHPFKYIPFHYMMLAKLYGYQYHILLGEEGKLKNQGGFRVDPAHFEKMIARMLEGKNQ